MSDAAGIADKKPTTTKPFTGFSSAAEEARMKAEHDDGEDQAGHGSSAAGLIVFFPSSDLPYVVTLTHSSGVPSAHGFATMREAEAFIRLKTPAIGPSLSKTYDRPAEDAQLGCDRGSHDKELLAGLKELLRGLRRISPEDGVSALADALVRAGIDVHDRMRIVVEGQRKVDELSRGQGIEPPLT